MKRYKYQALVTLSSRPPTGSVRAPAGDGFESRRVSQRVVVRAVNGETMRRELFSALLDCDSAAPFRPGSARELVTLRLVGDDVCDCLEVGSHFDLWCGTGAGEGVITSRLFV